jgi:hypothetical protein
MEATDERADAASAINVAVEQLGKTNSRAKRLYIISDFQRTNWSDVKFDAVPADARVLFVSVDSTARQNAGLTGLKIRPSTPCVGEPLTVQAEVFNSSSSPRTVPVTFTLSDPSAPLGTGSRNFSDSVQLAPYSSGNVSLPLTFDAPQRMECTATLPQDNLAGDNTRRLVIDLGRMATVLLITDEDTNATTSAAYYLVRALHPDPGSVAGFRVLPVHSNAVNNPMLKAADAVMVCNAPSMPPVQLEVLAKYAVSGGSLVWFLYGDRVAEQIKGLSAQLPKSEPAPLQVEGIANVQSRAKGFVTLSEARYESKLLKAFRDLTASDLGHIKFYKFSLTSEVQPRAELLLKFEDGTAAAVRCGEGSGNLLLLNMSPAPSWSDLARQQIFLPLMHEFLKGILAKDSGALEAFPGGTASTTIEPTSATLTCVDPLGQVVPVTMDKTTGSIVIDPARRAGIYHLTAGAQEVAALAVNPHPDESDLRSIDPRELESQREKSRSYLTGSTGNDPDVSDLDKGTPIWHYLLIFAIAALFAEQAVGRVGVRSRKGKTA